MAKIVAVANQKGGVGKTTTAVNLAAGLVALKKSVLLVDLDPQGNATIGLGMRLREDQQTICDVLLRQKTVSQVRQMVSSQFDVVPASQHLTLAEVRLTQFDQREMILREALFSVQEDYDFIVIDCPPAINVLTVNALVAAHSVLIPVQCEYYALEGLASLLNTIRRMRTSANPSLDIEGVLRTMYDGRNRLTKDVSLKLQQHFKTKLYQTVIPRNVRLAEAPSHGKSAMQYDKSSQGAVAYLALASEFLRKQQHEIPCAQQTGAVHE